MSDFSIKNLKSLFGKSPFKILGSSMLPLFQKNDLVYFEKIRIKQARVNDIVLVKRGRSFFVHRVIYKSKNFLVTKGDNNPESDGKINKNQVLGRVVRAQRRKVVFTPDNIYHIQSSHYFREILKIKKLFDKNRIDYVFLKGLPLYLFYQKKVPKKIYADCDVLIKRKNQSKAEVILKSSGYSKVDPTIINWKNKIPSLPQEISFQKIVSGFPVNFDVHFEPVFMMTQLPHLEALYPKKLISRLTNEFLKTKETISVNENKLYILNSINLIFYLCLHFSHHNFTGASRLELIDIVIRKSRLTPDQWDSINIKITDYRLGNFVYPVFLLLKKYFRTPIPNHFIKLANTASPTIEKINIFDSRSRFEAGIERFKNLFFLSPNLFWKKTSVFLDRRVLAFFVFSLKHLLAYFLKASLRTRQRRP